VSISLAHPKTQYFIRKFKSIRDFKIFAEWKYALEKLSKDIPPDEYRDNPLDTRNKFKGDMFEVFGEFFVKYFGKMKEVSIIEYTPNDPEDDYGVDGLGIGADGLKAAVQFKYRNNHTSEIDYAAIARFHSQAIKKFGVPFHNLLVISTVENFRYTVKEALGSVPRHINICTISRLVDNNGIFWKEFGESLTNSYIKPLTKPPQKDLWQHQKEAVNVIYPWMQSNEDKGQIIIPTGGGKTVIEHESVIASIDNGGLVHVVIDPRKALVDQLLTQEFWPYNNRTCRYLLVRSGSEVDLPQYVDSEYMTVPNTTVPTDIAINIDMAIKSKVPLIIFSTNHSVHRIGTALNDVGCKADLVIGDEAHNLTAENFGEILDDPLNLPSRKWLFFTATRRTTTSSLGKGMNNIERFGEVIYQVSPRRLIEEGIIVPPRIHYIYIDKNVILSSEKDLNAVSASMVESGILEHRKVSGSYCRVIVYCRSVDECHALRDLLEERGRLDEFTIDVITSDKSKMDERCEKLGTSSSKYRQYIFNRYCKSNNAVILNYSILSEGIDLPGTTGIMPIRQLEEIRTQQCAGRSVRILSEDRVSLSRDIIRPGIIDGWVKPFGWIILPAIPGDDEFIYLARNVIYAMRKADFNPDIVVSDIKERSITHIDRSDESDLFPDLPKSAHFIKRDIIDPIENQLTHEIEEEERALIRQDQTILEFAEWKGN